MDNSLKYCMDNISRSSYADRDFSSAYEIPFTNYMEPFAEVYNDGSWKYLITGTDNDENKFELNIEIIYNPDADFDYFTSTSCVNDGTLLFTMESVEKCVNKVLSGSTYCITKSVPNNKDFIRYTVGNVIVNTEHGDFGTSDKPWLQERVTVMLPIKYEIIKEKE